MIDLLSFRQDFLALFCYYTVLKMPKKGVFSGQYVPVFELDMDIFTL